MSVHLHHVPAPADAMHVVVEDLAYVCGQSDKALSLGGIVEAVLSGEAQLWMVLDPDGEYLGCYVTEIVEGGRFCHVVAARIRPRQGDAFERSLGQLGEWAHGFGARLSGTSRRPGMGRLLSRLGWEQRFVEYVEPESVVESEAAA